MVFLADLATTTSFVNPMTPIMKRYLAVTSKEKPSTLSSSSSSIRNTDATSKPMLTSSRSTRDLKKSTAVASGSSKPEVITTQHKAVEPRAEPQVRKERPPLSGPVRPPFAPREAKPPAEPSSEDKHGVSISTRRPVQQSQAVFRPTSILLSRPATSTGQGPESTTSRAGARRPDLTFKRPASPTGKSEATSKSSASRPNSVLGVEDLRKSTEERPGKGPRRVPKPPTPEILDKASQSARSAKVVTSSNKPVPGDRQGLSRSADADARKDALKAKLETQTALGVTQRHPIKGHARAMSQPANVATKDNKSEVKKTSGKIMPPPARSASTSSRPALSAPVKTFTKTVKGARAVVRPLTIRKGRRKSSLKAMETAVVPSATSDEVCDSDAQSEHTEPSSACSEPEGPAHPDEHVDSVPTGNPTEDEPTIREIAVLQSPVITPPPDSPGSTTISSDGSPAASSSCEMHTPPRALFPTFPLQPAATPISALLFSIERGFVAPTPSHSTVGADNTLPYPDNDAAEESEDEESVLKNIDFVMDGKDSCGKVLQSPRKNGVNSENRSPLGHVDTNCT